METPLPPLVQALLQPTRYPHLVPQVTLVQTHISWVLLAGDFAYKLKKPLKLAFLDFSTLALRHQACLDELRLNRRFAPDIYLDVVALYNTPDDPRFEAIGEPIDYAVKMRHFDESARLDRVCERGELEPAHLSDLAQSLTAFHDAAAVAPQDALWGTPAQVMAPVRDNLTDLLQALPQPALRARLLTLQAWSEAQFVALQPQMLSRKRAGWVRECHGDLHLANLVLLRGRVRMFDCLEFNADLRWIDVASDTAFTYIDLLAHGQPGLANWFVDEVLSHNGDYAGVPLLRFYAVYRCLVRAKVAAIRARQTHANDGETLTWIALAERLTASTQQRLLITHGVSGCGKTVVSTRLLQSDAHARTLRLRADVQRKRLFGLPDSARSASPLNAGLYAPDAHARTYGRLHDLAGMLLRAGWSVIVDATFLQRADRAMFHALAQALGVRFGIVAPQATPEQLRQRITARYALGQDASEATLDVLAQQLRAQEPLTVAEQALVVPVPGA